MQQWYDLLSKIKIKPTNDYINYRQDIWKETDLQAFENQNNIILPASYRDFCQVFGTAEFNNFFRIYCPNLILSQTSINNLKDVVEYQVECGEIKNPESMLELLDSGFVFGGNCQAHIYLWDMRTYKKLDQSYDIYLVGLGEIPLVFYPMGRNFFKFFYDFCLATKYYKNLPQQMRSERRRIWTAARYKISESEWVSDPFTIEKWDWEKGDWVTEIL